METAKKARKVKTGQTQTKVRKASLETVKQRNIEREGEQKNALVAQE